MLLAALEKFSKALYGTTGGTYSARVFRPVSDGDDVLITFYSKKKYSNNYFFMPS